MESNMTLKPISTIHQIQILKRRQYSSVTSKSLVLQLFNYKETDYSFKENLVIYDENNEECMKLDADYSVKLKTSSIFPVKFDKELEKGKYTIKIGEDYSLDFEVK